MEKIIEIPEGYEARIESNKIILEPKESEDERIRKELIRIFKSLGDGKIPVDINYADIFGWLEKQGVHKPVPFKAEHGKYYYCIKNYFSGGKKWASKGDVVQALRGLPIMGLDDASEFFLPVNNMQFNKIVNHNDIPKFKVGDWITDNKNTFKIVGNDNNWYCADDGDKIRFDIVHKFYHLWTIQDAKDGDVLVASDNSIFILKSVVNNDCICYIALSTDNSITLEDYWEVATAVFPATKKQRDHLFQKMKEAGYKWDAEKKGLKKIEQNPVIEMKSAEESLGIDSKAYNKIVDECIYGEQNPAWSDEDEEMLRRCISATFDHGYLKECDWLKSFKDKIQSHWKPTTEQLIYLKAAFEKYDFCDSERGALESLYNDIKKL